LNESGIADAIAVRQPAVSGARKQPQHRFRRPEGRDGPAIFDLIASCPPLDPNSLYCNLLQTTHFSGTCILAERDGLIDGWISGYRPPDDPDAMFVWQVAVHERARGCGLAVAMLDALLRLPAVAGATRLLTTVTPSNQPSRRMFDRFAAMHGARLTTTPWFDRDQHFGGGHESEELITISPLPPRIPISI
jgi:L-2,4-diaminobutyric acid acetyltransferase